MIGGWRFENRSYDCTTSGDAGSCDEGDLVEEEMKKQSK